MSHATKPARPRAGIQRPQFASAPALVIMVSGAMAYLFFLAVLGHAVGFFVGLGVPRGIDQGPAPPCLPRRPSTCSCCCCSRFSIR